MSVSTSDASVGVIEQSQVQAPDLPPLHNAPIASLPQSSPPTPHIAPLARSLNLPRFFFPSDPPMVRVALRARRLSLSSFSNTFLSTPIDEEQEDEDLGGMEDHGFEARPESAEEVEVSSGLPRFESCMYITDRLVRSRR